MTGEKVWTLRKREHAKLQRSHEQAVREVAAQRRSAITRAGLLTIVVVAVFIAAGVSSNRSHAPAVVAFSAGSGLVVASAWLAHRWLRPRLGRITALLVISMVGAAAFLAIAAASPQCPDATDAGRCTTGELANWSMVGLTLPIVAALTVGTPLLVARSLVRLSRLVYKLATGRATFADFLPGRRPLATGADKHGIRKSTSPSVSSNPRASAPTSSRP